MHGLNMQPPEEVLAGRGHEGLFLDVIKIWHTIQGEGPFAGRPAAFIRLAGCNLACPACDTNYTHGRHSRPVEQVVIEAATPSGRYDPDLVVLTGGEPYRQNINSLVTRLLQSGFEVQIETNGTLFQQLPYDNRKLTVVCSPKAPAITSRLKPFIGCYKYVLDHRHVNPENGLPLDILGDPKLPPAYPPAYFPRDRVYVQPLDTGDNYDERAANWRAAKESCLKFGWRLGVQMHKLFDLE